MNCRRVPVPFITCGNNRHGTYGSALLPLRFELLNECSEVRRDWGREGVVVVLQALPDCREPHQSVAGGVLLGFVFSGVGSATGSNRVPTNPVVDLVSYGGAIAHGPLPRPSFTPRQLNKRMHR